MKFVAFIVALLWAGAASAQSACNITQSTSVNPTVGSVMTWCGPSVGAQWIPGTITGPLTSVVGDVAIWTTTNGTALGDPTGTTASRLNNRAGNYSPTAGYQNGTPGGTATSAGIIEVLGSSGTPDSTQDAVSIFQKWSNSSTNYGAPNPTLYASLHMVNGSAASRGAAAFFETRQEVNRVGDGNFIEGSRSHGIIAAGVAGGNVYGGLFVAGEEAGATHLHDMIGVESEVINQTGDAPYTPVNLDVLESAYLATSFFGTKKPLAAFMVNPFTPGVASWQVGFYVPPSALTDIGAPVVGAAFRSDAKSIWGLDLLGRISTGGLGGPPTFGAIGIANNSPIRASNNAKTQTPSILSLHTDDVLHVGEDTALAGVTLGGGTGGFFQLGSSAMFAANGAVATVLGGVGPVGSHTTVQKWIVVKDDTGATFYVPAF
jgi:hypothetical protein